ncbi:MAG: thioredoxin domain-containing protein [Dehalococcoidia bacterium]|nr:thioredoxin domain-containing protein [Dehalococcoidia bacterium]
MPNRLINETSPYLLQHAHNPVDWFPWGQEAFARAKAEDKPVFLSVGYAACHWCHVMERESFENVEIARQMNESFVCIKVDREERPDVDAIYMQAVQVQTGRGGWPMTVFLTPEGKPFYGGTYFPPDDQHGMPGLPRLLTAMAEGYRSRRAEVVRSAAQLVDHLRSGVKAAQGTEPLTAEILSTAYQGLASEFDGEHGGFGSAPKFPQPMIHEFLLRYHSRTNDAQALSMVDFTLECMARGGMYDQLGGGFHRYSTDPFWMVPHFEKMLYDNALLSRLYLHTYLLTGNLQYLRVTQETLDYVLREMTSPQGGFYSTQDADSEGKEGTYYLWTPGEIESVVGKEKADVFCRYFGVTQEGNFEGRSILSIRGDHSELAQELGISDEELSDVLEETRNKLMDRRQGRVPPARDEKVVTAWNGLMLRTLAEAASVLGRQDYLLAAASNASFLLANLKDGNGRLLRTYKDGQARLKGYLEDYAFVIDGLLALHEATLDLKWLREARTLADAMLDLFWDEGEQAFYDTGRDHEELILRPRDVFDNATPCGGSVAADVLQRLAILTGNQDYSHRAVASLRSLQSGMAQAPQGFGHWLCALDFYLSTPKEIAVVGPVDHPATQALLEQVHGRYLPNKVVTGFSPDDSGGAAEFPLLDDKYMVDGKPSVFVCQNYSCLLPVTDPEALAEQLSPESPQ